MIWYLFYFIILIMKIYFYLQSILNSSVQFFLYIFNNILIASSLQYYDKDTWYKQYNIHILFYYALIIMMRY